LQEFQYIQDILKEFYTPVIVNQVYKKAPFWAQMKKKSKGVYGKKIVIPIQLGFTEAVGAKADNNYDLPNAQRNTYDRSEITLKRNYGRVMIDGFSIESSKGKGGWVDQVSAESKGASTAFALDIDRQSLMNGKGELGHVNGAISGQIITVNKPGGVTGDTPNTKWFRKGMVIDIRNTSGVSHADSVQISLVDVANSQITVVGTITSVVTTDIIYREDTYVASGQGEMMGIEGIINTVNTPGATFQGIDRTAEALWQAYVATSVGVVSEDAIQVILDGLEAQTDGDSPTFILTTTLIRRKIVALAKSAYQVQTLKLKAGWEGIKFVGGTVELPIVTHKNCPLATMYFPSMNHIKFYSLKSLVWDNKGGGVLKPVAGKDAYEAWFKMYGNIGTDCSNAHGKGTGVLVA